MICLGFRCYFLTVGVGHVKESFHSEVVTRRQTCQTSDDHLDECQTQTIGVR
ncbi:unnamed protein product [Heligmosomoides polygyrus]|uniref:Secreted protein n=1 Tax=Heligmosomoides polygyrus TaxID=6339 RepID=A0A183FVU1_HELPZ|nr:unnamed protein product [Heligmosomoides polygyrus]